MRLIPDIDPKLFSFSAIAVGYLLIDDTTANEQNALGNWLMLVAQVLCTNAFYKQVQAERATGNTLNNQNIGNNDFNNSNNKETIIMMQKMIDALNKELEELKKGL